MNTCSPGLAPLLLLMMSCAASPPVRPEPGAQVSASGVKVELGVAAESLMLLIWNQSRAPLSVMPSAVKLFKDEQMFSPVDAPPPRILWSGGRLPLRLSYSLLDGVSLSEAAGAKVHVDTALSQEGRPLALAPFTLARSPEPQAAIEGTHVSLTAGYSYNYFYDTHLQGGFAELRLGGQVDNLELTARLRLQLGRTEAGRLVIAESVGFGLLHQLYPRVWLGFDLSSIPPLSWMVVQRRDFLVRDMIFEAGVEVRIDLARGQKQALYFTARPGLLLGIASDPVIISPNILVGIGYGYHGAAAARPMNR